MGGLRFLKGHRDVDAAREAYLADYHHAETKTARKRFLSDFGDCGVKFLPNLKFIRNLKLITNIKFSINFPFAGDFSFILCYTIFQMKKQGSVLLLPDMETADRKCNMGILDRKSEMFCTAGKGVGDGKEKRSPYGI